MVTTSAALPLSYCACLLFSVVTKWFCVHSAKTVRDGSIITSGRNYDFTFAIIFTNMAILWISWFTLCSFDVYKINLPAVVRYFGIVINLLGAGLFFTALFTIKTLETYDGDLITKGIYSKVRHPMYLGFICWLIGAPLLFGAAISFALAVLFIANVLFWRHLEEIELEKRFAGYRDYKIKTIF